VSGRPFLSRQERFGLVGSTNDVIRDWLAAGTPEVCLALADEQSAGRGREGRRWVAPSGTALLLSLGFRPSWLAPDRVWRLAATVSLAMADASEEVAGLPDRAIRLKWPNDLVVEGADPGAGVDLTADADASAAAESAMRKVGGVLGETVGLGSADPRAIVGIGVNAAWRASDFPPELAASMTSLGEASGGRPIDLPLLLDAFLARLEVRIEALRGGRFDVADWIDRQMTTGRRVELARPDGSVESARAIGVDARSGALVIEDPAAPGGERAITSGEIVRLRPAATVASLSTSAPVISSGRV
jgi:BirA family transcriptional regulator, biotin operon repressor / biotin---[acetyl-CoA-carboxylase] ligase